MTPTLLCIIGALQIAMGRYQLGRAIRPDGTVAACIFDAVTGLVLVACGGMSLMHGWGAL